MNGIGNSELIVNLIFQGRLSMLRTTTLSFPRRVLIRKRCSCPEAQDTTRIGGDGKLMRISLVSKSEGTDTMELSDATKGLLSRITIDPGMLHGKPAIRGMRYPVELILELLSSGMTHEEILEDYDDLEEDDIRACLAFAWQLSMIKSIDSIPIRMAA